MTSRHFISKTGILLGRVQIVPKKGYCLLIEIKRSETCPLRKRPYSHHEEEYKRENCMSG